MRETLICLVLAGCLRAASPVGVFEDHADVGTVLHPGAVEYDAAKGSYTIAGSGENMWFAADAFQFAWKQVSGDVTLTANVSFVGEGKEGHRKAVLMIRQSLDADSAYADVARHGDGLTSLQARDEKGAITTEVQAATAAPARLRIVKHGDQFYMWLAGPGEDLRFSGAAMWVPLHDPFYVGIGVCSHNKDVVERAVFSNVEISTAAPVQTALYSTLEVVPAAGDRRAVYVARGCITAPHWSDGGDGLTFAHNGREDRVAVAGGAGSPAPPEKRELVTQAFSRIARQEREAAGANCSGAADEPVWSPDNRRLAFVSYHRVPLAHSDWGPLQFLIGKWTGEGSGQPGNGSGSFSLLPDLQDHVLVRKSFAEYPASGGKPGFRHDDLMVVHREEETGDLRATYWDSEGHVISYAVKAVKGGAALESDGPPSQMRYRLTYIAAGPDRAHLTFEVAAPGRDFAKYIDAALRREH